MTARAHGAPGLRLPELDVLRAVAVVAVLGSHFPFLGNLEDLRPAVPGPLVGALALWQRAGWIGVDLFFVLSGFLVSGLLFQELARHGSIDGKRFFLRRGLKIYPAFYTFLAASVVLQLTLADPLPPVVLSVRAIGELLFLQNYYGSMWNHTWTLAVEEHFYVVLLLLAMLLARLGRGRPDPFRPIPRIFVVVAVGLLALRLLLAHVLGYGATTELQERLLVWTHTRIDSLFFGVVLSYAWHLDGERMRRVVERTWPALLVVAIVGIAPALAFERIGNLFIPTFGFTLQYLAFGALLAISVTWSARRDRALLWRRLAPVALVGRHSYSIYLWHMVVATYGVHLFRRAAGRSDLLALEIVLYVLASLALGIGMSLLVEQPVLRLRERWLPSRSSTA